MLEYYANTNAKQDERTRAVTYSLYVWNTADKKKIPISKFWPLITDKVTEKLPIDKEKIKQLQERALQRLSTRT